MFIIFVFGNFGRFKTKVCINYMLYFIYYSCFKRFQGTNPMKMTRPLSTLYRIQHKQPSSEIGLMSVIIAHTCMLKKSNLYTKQKL